MKHEEILQNFTMTNIVEFTREAINSDSFATELMVGDTATVVDTDKNKYGFYPSKLVVLDGECKGMIQWIAVDTIPDKCIERINFATWFDKVN